MLGAFLMGAMSMAFAQVPQFKDYPVKVYSGPSAKLVLDNEDAKEFRTNFTNALKLKPNFSGEYVIATWGCGAGCQSYNFISKKTGRVLNTDINEFGGQEEGEMIDGFRADSNLLITSTSTYNDDHDFVEEIKQYYVFKNGKFQLIQKAKTKKPSDE